MTQDARGTAPAGPSDPGGPLASYRARCPAGVTDELFGPAHEPRPGHEDLLASIGHLGRPGLLARRSQVRGLLEDDGVTYGTRPRRWDVDPLPLIVDAARWGELERGLAQRAALLDLLLGDLYGPQATLRHGLIPPEVVLAHTGFLREAYRIPVPGGRRLLLAATDLARDGDGRWRVLGDRSQAPSGAGYAMEDRRVVSRVMGGLYRDLRPARLRTFFHALRVALEEAAPPAAEAPRVVLLSPGPSGETAFDQAFLASLLGYPLVEGRDLMVRDGRVWMRSLGRPEPVDVVLRRVDAGYADPLELRPDSRLGVAGLMEAARSGHVSVVNPFGAAVLENPGLLPFLPAVCRTLLGEPLRLESVQTFWCGDDASRRHVLARLPELVIRPITRAAGRSSRFGWELSTAEVDDLRARIEAEPWQWCGQVPLPLSSAPVVTRAGVQPRRLVLRTFAVASADGYRIMTGGLARVAADGAGQLVSSQAGAVAKDVWVLAGDPGDGWTASPQLADAARSSLSGAGAGAGAGAEAAAAAAAGAEVAAVAGAPVVVPGMAPRAAEDLFWLGRYAERAEDGVRLLRVVTDLAEDYALRPRLPGAQALRVLLGALARVTGTEPVREQPPGLQADLLALTVDARRPGSLAHAVGHTVQAAHAVREQLSVDTWVMLGSLDRVLAELAAAAQAHDNASGPDGASGPVPVEEGAGTPPLQPALARVLEGLLALAGLGAESMVRDEGWALMDIGRRIERAVQLLGLLRGTLTEQRPAPVDGLVTEAVLQAAESVITYRRRLAAGRLPTGTPSAQVAGVLQLLLVDRANPRSLAYQLDRLAEDLALLDTDGAGALVRRVRDSVARLREGEAGTLALARADGARPGLAALLDGLTTELEELATAVRRRYFPPQAPPRQLPAGLGWGAS